MKIEVIPNEQTPEVPIIEDIKQFIHDNRDLLDEFKEYAAVRNDAVGLAANQCSVDGERIKCRFFALRDVKTNEWSIIINPSIDEYVGIKEIKSEGCLTWKGQTVVAERSRGVRVKYWDMNGESHYDLRKGFDAQIWQHEINHLDGIEEDVRESYDEPKPIDVNRNDTCPCGSGRKYKKCCLLLL